MLVDAALLIDIIFLVKNIIQPVGVEIALSHSKQEQYCTKKFRCNKIWQGEGVPKYQSKTIEGA